MMSWRCQQSSPLFQLDGNLSSKVLDYLDAGGLLAIEECLSQWSPLISPRWVFLDQAISPLAKSSAQSPRHRLVRFEECSRAAASAAKKRFRTFDDCDRIDDECKKLPCEIFLRFGRTDGSVIWQGFVGKTSVQIGRDPGWKWGVRPIPGNYLLDESREREILDNWPKLKKLVNLLEFDGELGLPPGVNGEEGWDNMVEAMKSVMRNVTFTIVRINQAGTKIEYSGRGLFGYDYQQFFTPFYFTPYPEEESLPDVTVVHFAPDLDGLFRGFGLVSGIRKDELYLTFREDEDGNFLEVGGYSLHS